MPKAVAIIPARWGSTRFPGKPLHPIAGKPLLQHVWERTSKARKIERVIVATDDMRIAKAAFAFGAEVALTSPKHRSGTDRVAEVAGNLKSATHVINVQGDEPVVDPKLIDRLVNAMFEDRDLEMATAANAFAAGDPTGNPNVVKVVTDRNGNALYFSRSAIPFVREGEKAPPIYRHHGIYGYSRRFLLQFVRWKPTPLEQAEQLEQLRALEHGAKIRVLVTQRASVGVDTPADVARAEAQMAKAR